MHGADPELGSGGDGVGKATTADEVDQSRVVIRFGAQEVYPAPVDESGLDALCGVHARRHDRDPRRASPAATRQATVWGCDLTDGYVRINADYTT